MGVFNENRSGISQPITCYNKITPSFLRGGSCLDFSFLLVNAQSGRFSGFLPAGVSAEEKMSRKQALLFWLPTT
jgi:hypothetical protein